MSTNYPVKIYYHDGSINKVDDSTKKAVQKAVEKATEKLKNKETLKNLNIHVASDFSNLPKEGSELNKYLKENDNMFRATKGLTNDDKTKEIFIQETGFFGDKIGNIFSFSPSFSANDEIEQATMHEIGHQFDFSGGDKKIKEEYYKLVEKYKDKQFENTKVTPSEGELLKEYIKNNGYSDKKEFKAALEKDLKSIDLNYRTINKFGYFIGEFYNRGTDIKPNEQDIENAEMSRMEVFAQLFSYAMGTNDGEKENFVKLFSNSYEVVKKYIKEE